MPGSIDRPAPGSIDRPAPGSIDRPAPVGRLAWDQVIAALASAQHGVVSRRQLLARSVSAAAIDLRLRRGRLHRLHPGIYLVGHDRPTVRGRWLAATMWAGPDGHLSRASAASLHGLIDRVPATIDVVSSRTPTPRHGLRGRRVRPLPAADRAVIDGIPVTSVARTLSDLAMTMEERRFDRMLGRCEELRVYDAHAIDEILGRSRPGAPRMRAAVAVFAGSSGTDLRTRSELERRFLDLLRAARFVLPEVNVTVRTPWATYEVDALWRDRSLVVELDGWSTHRDRESFRRDHRRTVDLSAAGYRVVRLDWAQVVDRPAETARRLDRLIARTGP